MCFNKHEEQFKHIPLIFEWQKTHGWHQVAFMAHYRKGLI